MNKTLATKFQDGYYAFRRVSTRKNKRFGECHHQMANPFGADTTSHKEWQRGWEAAYFENLEKLNGLGTRG